MDLLWKIVFFSSSCKCKVAEFALELEQNICKIIVKLKEKNGFHKYNRKMKCRHNSEIVVFQKKKKNSILLKVSNFKKLEKIPSRTRSSVPYHSNRWTLAAILDLKVTYILNFNLYRSIVILTHENIGLDTNIESLTCIFLVLWPIYRFWVMAAGGRVPPGAATIDIWWTGVVPIFFFCQYGLNEWL